MSKLITEQEGQVEASNKKDSEIINQLGAKNGQDESPSSSSSGDDTFVTPTGLKKQKNCKIDSDKTSIDRFWVKQISLQALYSNFELNINRGGKDYITYILTSVFKKNTKF